MMTLLALRSTSAVSVRRSDAPRRPDCRAGGHGGLAGSVPKPPAITLMKLRFIAVHMM
jgi:hypothetical protein